MCKRAARILALSLFAVCLFAFAAQAAADKRLVLGANAANTTQYVMAAAFSQIVGKYAPITLEALAQGNVVTLPMLSTGDCDLIVAATDELDAAYFAKGVYGRISKDKGFETRMLMMGSPIAAGFIVAGDSGITRPEQLKGKRVVLDFGTHYALNTGARASLYTSSLSESDVTVMKANLIPEAARMVIEGKADALFCSLGVPAVRELAVARGGARHLPVLTDQAGWDKAHEMFAGYYPQVIEPSEANFTIHEPTLMVVKNFALVGAEALSDDDAYAITKILWEHDSELAPFHPDLRTWTKDIYVGTVTPVPYHPGAIKFYKEVGAWTDEVQAHNDKLIQQRVEFLKK